MTPLADPCPPLQPHTHSCDVANCKSKFTLQGLLLKVIFYWAQDNAGFLPSAQVEQEGNDLKHSVKELRLM